MPGVEIHAQVVESALTGAVVSQPNYGIALEFFAAMILGILVITFAPGFGPVRLVATGAVFATILIGTSWYFYARYRLLIDFTYPLLSTTAIYLTLIFASFVREQRQRMQIRGQFAQYMSPVLVEQLALSPEKLVLGGEEREMTIMFFDVRGLPTISLDDKEHEITACEAAIQMLEEIDRLNKEREQEAADGGHVYIPLNVGVGLNTGIGVVGNMGSDRKFNYSVLGDSVNLASRLEGQSKEYGFPIIVGSKTALAAKDRFAILELDFIMVKGKKEPEVIYALAGREDVAQSERFQRLRNLTVEMLACYRDRDWDGALAAIERGRSSDDAHALDYLYNLYEARILNYRTNPPPDDWNGAYQLLTK